MLKKTIAFFMVLLITISMQPQFSKADELTLQDRETLAEKVKLLLYGEKRARDFFFGGALYADNERVVFMHAVHHEGRRLRYSTDRYVERYDFVHKKRERMVPYIFWQAVPNFRCLSLDVPKQMALFKKDDGAVLIEMDYITGEWKEIHPWPTEDRPLILRAIPNTTLFAYSISEDGRERNNPYLFGLSVFDWKTGENQKLLTNVRSQNNGFSSAGNYFGFKFLDSQTVIYTSTHNPQSLPVFPNPEKFIHPLDNTKKLEFPYYEFWKLNRVTGEKVRLATSPVVYEPTSYDTNNIIWKGIEIGSATDIIQRKK